MAQNKLTRRRGGIFALAAAVLSMLLLTSCLDVVQTIETNGNQVLTQLRISFSKALIEGGASMSGEEPDYSDLPDFTGDEGMVATTIPGGDVQVEEVNNESDYGVMVTASYTSRNLSSLSAEDRAFFPLVDGNRIEILLPPNEDSEEMDEMTAMFFGGSKYRILIQKNTQRRQISEILVGGEPGLASVMEMDGVFLVEIPLFLWLSSTEVLPIEIFFR
jgi:hypothetical protein